MQNQTLAKMKHTLTPKNKTFGSKRQSIAMGMLIGFFAYLSSQDSKMSLAVAAFTTLVTWISLKVLQNTQPQYGRFFNPVLTTKNHADDHYQIEILKSEHIDEVIQLFTKTFCEYEPMTQYLGITKLQFLPFAEKIIKKAALDRLSIIAHDGKNVVACAIVEDIANPAYLELSEMDPKFRFVFGLLESLSGHFFQGKTFKKNNLSHLFITAVDVQHQGRGLSRKVNVAAMKLSKENGFDVMCCEFTNNINEKGTIKLIEQKKALIGSCTYKDFSLDGMKPFQHLDGDANAYLWELNPEARLIYYQTNQGLGNLVSHRLEEEFQPMTTAHRKCFTI